MLKRCRAIVPGARAVGPPGARRTHPMAPLETPTAPPGSTTVIAGSTVARHRLTPAETYVLTLLASGLPNREIARRLKISVITVKTHVRHVLRKLGVETRLQAALLAIRPG